MSGWRGKGRVSQGRSEGGGAGAPLTEGAEQPARGILCVRGAESGRSATALPRWQKGGGLGGPRGTEHVA